jgi:hypothetical protein
MHDGMRSGHALDRFPHAWLENKEFARREVEAAEASRPTGEEARLRAAYDREGIDPAEAVAMLRKLVADASSPKVRERAKARLAAAEDSSTRFSRALRGWKVLMEIRALKKSLKSDESRASSWLNEAFRKRNKSALLRIQALTSGFLKDEQVAPTRARLAIEDLTAELGIPIPEKQLECNRVVGELIGRITAVSTPRRIKEVYPYTQAFVVHEYVITKVLKAEPAEGFKVGSRIAVVHQSMDADAYFPPHDYKVGKKDVHLKLATWAAQTFYEAHPISDELEDMTATRYFQMPGYDRAGAATTPAPE